MDFNPRPPCGGRPHKRHRNRGRRAISIHAPRAGGDPVYSTLYGGSVNFNPRPPCGGRRFCTANKPEDDYFNPRPPCGGRRYRRGHGGHGRDFNPRPPCGGRLFVGPQCDRSLPISIHAPRAGGDLNAKWHRQHQSVFQSTPPVRGATWS